MPRIISKHSLAFAAIQCNACQFDCIIHSNSLSKSLRSRKIIPKCQVLLTHQKTETFSYITKLHDHTARKRDITKKRTKSSKYIVSNIQIFFSSLPICYFSFVHFHHIFAIIRYSFFIQSRKMNGIEMVGARGRRRRRKTDEEQEQQERETELRKLAAEEWEQKCGSKRMKWE